MKIKILNWFGLTTLTTYREIEDRAKDYHKLISNLTSALAEYENKPTPSLEFTEFKKDKPSDEKFKVLFDEWYSIYCRNQYQAYKIRQLTKHPHLLNAFMLEFSSFDWNSVSEYMEKTNWFWNDNDRIPTLAELKDCVITLIPDGSFDHVGNALSSGGFKVALYYDNDCNPVCKIEFKKEK